MNKIKMSNTPLLIPHIVTWRLTSRCNNSCRYCYGPDTNTPELNLTQIDNMLNLLSTQGVLTIDLTGGEPLLRTDFPEILRLLEKYHFKIFMDTNGDFFQNYQSLITQKVTGIGLTIDYPSSLKSFRISGNFNRVINILENYRNTHTRPFIRIGTVVTQENYHELEAVGRLLTRYPVDLWKLYQFIPQNPLAMANRQALKISQRQFISATKDLPLIFNAFFPVIASPMSDRDSCYFFIGSNGTVFMPTQKRYIFVEKNIGNIFDHDIFSKWQQSVSAKNYLHNAIDSHKIPAIIPLHQRQWVVRSEIQH